MNGTLEARGITVRFGGHEALGSVDLRADSGAITGLIGPNGAGKTTMFNVLCGLTRPVSGSVELDGRDITRTAPHKRARMGLARTFQRLETFTLLTVRENVLAGAEFRRRWSDSDEPPDEVARQLLERLGLVDVADDRVDTLPTGRARLVELGRALAARPSMLLLDEPSSGLDERETEELGQVLQSVAHDGLGILLVEHDMAMVMSVCTHVSVLDFGAMIASGTPEEIREDALVQQAYLGDSTMVRTARPPSTERRIADAAPLLEIDRLSAGYGDFDVVDEVSLSIRAGEVFAILGPNGAGKTTLLKSIGGLINPTAGQVRILGTDVTGAGADALARAGMCIVPEGRGVFPNLTVAENLWMMTGTGQSRADVEEIAYNRFARLAERRTQVAGTLSGGEQQMLAMARALATDPALLILDELSMGLAPLIVSELYQEVGRLASEGLTIVVVEQFAHEVLGIADRAAIMVHGHLDEPGDPVDVSARLEAAYLTGTTTSP